MTHFRPRISPRRWRGFWPLSDGPEELPLDPEQQAAVEATERAIAVLAGPGSGKTRVLSYRARHLLADDRGAHALMLTFTNKAAAEMKARAVDVAIVTTDRIAGSTFHTFAMRVLQAHGNLVGLGDFEVLDESDRQELALEAATRAGTRDRFNRLSYLRLRRYEPREAEVVEFGAAYQDLKRAQGLVDFDDLIVLAAHLLEQNELVAEAIAGAHPHILVDEFQDTNPAQFAIVRALFEHARTISVFADDDQAIYQFAGAEPGNIRRFIDELEARRYLLTTNYRCRSEIVNRANRLIAADQGASGRQMRAHYEGGTVRSRSFPSLEEEAAALTAEIEALISEEGVKPADIAILGRRRTRLEWIMETLEQAGVPVSNWLGPQFEADERQALATCLSVARGSLTDRQARRLCGLLHIDLSEEHDPQQLLLAQEGLRAASILLELREQVWAGVPVLQIVNKAQEAVACVDSSLADRMDAIHESVEAFQAFDVSFGIEHLTAELALGGVHGAPTAGGGVKIASLHRTKGLQWPHVYLLGMEDGMLPDYRADTPGTMSEERRTCFVGVCRAEFALTLSRVRVANGRLQAPSPFLREMGFDA